jgi:hypothetical protein
LRTDCGVLGVAKHMVDGSSETITDSTERVLRALCTPCHNPPRGADGLAPSQSNKFDQALFVHICEHIELLMTDGAGNEQLSQDQGRGRRGVAQEQATKVLTPNLIMVTRDCAHASRRTPARAPASALTTSLHRHPGP